MTKRELEYMLDLWEIKRAADQEIAEKAMAVIGSRSEYGHKDPTSAKAEMLQRTIDIQSRCEAQLAELSAKLDAELKKQSDSFAAAIIKAEYIDGYYYSDIMNVAHKMGEQDAEERRARVLRNIMNASVKV